MGFSIGGALGGIVSDPIGTLTNTVAGGTVLGPVGSAAGALAGGGGLAQNITDFAGNILGGPFSNKQIPQLPTVPKPGPFMAKNLLDYNLRLPTQLTLEPNMSAITKMRDIALGSEMSPWAAMSASQLAQLKDRQASQINARNQSAAEAAMNALASRRGLDAQSRALLEDQSRNQNMLDQQALRRQEKQQLANLETQDAQLKQNLLQGLPQLELAMAGVDQQNILNRLTEKRRTDALDKARYKAEMGNFGAEQTSKAIAESGGGGLLDGLLGILG